MENDKLVRMQQAIEHKDEEIRDLNEQIVLLYILGGLGWLGAICSLIWFLVVAR